MTCRQLNFHQVLAIEQQMLRAPSVPLYFAPRTRLSSPDPKTSPPPPPPPPPRIRSCSGGAASAYLEVLPIAHNLRIANSHLTWELRFRLGIQVMPSSSASRRCPCGEVLRATRDADHALVCPKNSGVRTLRHDHLNRVWCGAARCAGVATHWTNSSFVWTLRSRSCCRIDAASVCSVSAQLGWPDAAMTLLLAAMNCNVTCLRLLRAIVTLCLICSLSGAYAVQASDSPSAT